MLKKRYLISLLLLMSGCSNNRFPSEYNVLEESHVVSQDLVEFLAARSFLEEAGQDQPSRIKVVSLPVEDPLGHPFFNLTLTTAEPVNDFWSYAEAANAKSAFRVENIGASDAREIFGGGSQEGSYLRKLATTRSLLINDFDRYVAFNANLITIKGYSGKYYDALSAAEIPSEEVNKLINEYRQLILINSTKEMKVNHSNLWKNIYSDWNAFSEYKKRTAIQQENIGEQMSSFMKERLLRSTGTNSSAPGCYADGRLYYCFTDYWGEISSRMDYNGGYEQEAGRFPSSVGTTFSAYKSTINPFTPIVPNQSLMEEKTEVIGCTNASIISMLQWMNKYEGVTLSYSMPPNPNETATYYVSKEGYLTFLPVPQNGVIDRLSHNNQEGIPNYNSLVHYSISYAHGEKNPSTGNYRLTLTQMSSEWITRMNEWLRLRRNYGMDSLLFEGWQASPTDQAYRRSLLNTLKNAVANDRPLILALPTVHWRSGAYLGTSHATLLTGYEARDNGVYPKSGSFIYYVRAKTKDWPDYYATLTDSWVNLSGYYNLRKSNL